MFSFRNEQLVRGAEELLLRALVSHVSLGDRAFGEENALERVHIWHVSTYLATAALPRLRVPYCCTKGGVLRQQA